MNMSDVCSRIIKLGFYLIFALVPLLLTPWNYELFEYNKMMAVYGITTIIITAWLVKMVSEKEIRIAKTPLDIPIALFVTSQLVSSLFSMDPHVSWFGYYSRFNGGMWSIISYVLLYYAYVSNWTRLPAPERSDGGQANLLKTGLATAAVVALYGIAERLGVDKHLWVQDVQNRVFSTLGQPNWLAAYLTALIPLTWYFALRTQISEHNVQKHKKLFIWSLSSVFWVLLSTLFFVVLLFTRSRSGLLGFVVADVVFWALISARPRPANRLLQGEALQNTRKSFVFIHILFALIIFFNGSNITQIDRYFSLQGLRSQKGDALQDLALQASPGPALESGGTESGVIRKYVWQGAINAWKSSAKTILIGTGTETFAFAFYQHRPAGHNMTSEWDFLYNKAHNEYLNYLATTGAFGLGTYLLFIGTFIVWYVRYGVRVMRYEENQKQPTHNSLMTHYSSLIPNALFAGWLSIFVTNFFGFSVVIVQVFLFLFPAMMVTTHIQQYSNRTIKQLRLPQWTRWTVCIAGIFIVVRVASLWWADTRFALGYRNNRNGQVETAKVALTQATLLNSAEPVYRDEIATTLASLSVDAFEGGDATAAATLAQEALTQNDQALRISPANVNFWKTRTKIYYSLAAFEPSLNDAAITALERAARLSPNDPKIFYNLAILEGRSGNNGKAVEYLLKSKVLKPNYRDAYYGLYIFYTEMKKPKEAQEILKEYLTSVDPNDKDFQTLIK